MQDPAPLCPPKPTTPDVTLSLSEGAAGLTDELDAGAGLLPEPRVRAWDRRLATAVSGVASPPVLVAAMTALQASISGESDRWLWASVYISCAVLIPLAYLVHLFKHGEVGDLDLRRRSQRFRPQFVTVSCFGTAWAILRFGSAPAPMTAVAGALLLQSLAVLAITLRWKISVHSATAAAAGVVVWSVFGALIPVLVAIALVAWSRLRLRYHSPGQVAAGALLGLAVFGLAL